MVVWSDAHIAVSCDLRYEVSSEQSGRIECVRQVGRRACVLQDEMCRNVGIVGNVLLGCIVCSHDGLTMCTHGSERRGGDVVEIEVGRFVDRRVPP